MSENSPFYQLDDDTLLELYNQAHARGDEMSDAGEERCAAITAELQSRGIQVPPCGEHRQA